MSITILDSTTVDGTLLISSISNSATDTDRFVVSDGGVLKYRTGAQVRSDIGAGTGNGTVTSVGVSAGAGLSGGGTVTTSGTISLALDLGELGIGGALVGTDYIIAENGGVDNRQLVSSIPLSIFNNNSGWTSNTGTVTSVATSLPLTGGTITGAGTIGINQASGSQDGYLSAADWTTFNGKSDTVGTVTSVAVAAGTGMSGGGTVTTSGTITLTNSDRGSSQNIFKNIAVSGQTSIVADNNNDTLTFAAGNNITLSTNATTDTLTITANINPGDITGVTATAPLTGGGTSGDITVGISQSSDTTDGYLSFTDWKTFNSKTSNTGTVTSVGISHAGNAFTAGSAVTTSGTLAITMAGTATQYINGQGNLVTFPAIPQGDITAVVAGSGLSGGGTSGSVTLTNSAPNVTTNLSTTIVVDTVTINSSDGTNATIPAASVTAAGVMTSDDRKKLDGIAVGATNVTNNNQLTNGAGYITDGNTGWNNTYGFITASSTDTLTNKSGNISQWTNDSGYTTNVGDITGVTAGTGISGGGTSGTVTITNSDRGSSQNIFKNVAVSGQTTVVADSNNDTLTFAAGSNITLTTDATTDTVTITANINPGDITGVTAGTGLSGGGTSGTVTLSIDSTVATLTGTQTFTNKSGNISQWTNDSGYTTNVGDITGVTAGSGLSGGGTSGTVTLTNSAPNVTTNLSTIYAVDTVTVVSSDGTNATIAAANDTAAGVMTSDDRKKLGGIAAGATNVTNNNQLINGAGYTTNVGDITGVTAGTNLTGGGTSGTVTLNMATGGAGAGVYGSTTDGTKIDTITLDAYGRVTAVTSGATGDIQGITAGSGLSGGGTSGTVTLTNAAPNVSTNLSTTTATTTVTVVSSDGTNATIPAATTSAAGVMTSDDRKKLDGIAAGATNVTNNNQLTNGAGYTTNTGDITSVGVGNGLTGGGTSGAVTVSMSGTYTGNFTATQNITAYSDERLKTNIETIPNALEKVNSLRGVTFDKDGVRGLGVIAQEVEKILPEVVIEGEEYKSVAYGNIVGVLIEAIKELTNEVEELKRKLN